MTAPDEEHAAQPQPGVQDDAPFGEPLEELAWAYDAPLVLTQPDPYPHEHWLLTQAGRSVLAIHPTTGGWSLDTPAACWRAAVRRRRRRLGWHLEFTRKGEREPELYYYPYTLLRGGKLVLAGGARYKLRYRDLLEEGWTAGRRWGRGVGPHQALDEPARHLRKGRSPASRPDKQRPKRAQPSAPDGGRLSGDPDPPPTATGGGVAATLRARLSHSTSSRGRYGTESRASGEPWTPLSRVLLPSRTSTASLRSAIRLDAGECRPAVRFCPSRIATARDGHSGVAVSGSRSP